MPCREKRSNRQSAAAAWTMARRRRVSHVANRSAPTDVDVAPTAFLDLFGCAVHAGLLVLQTIPAPLN